MAAVEISPMIAEQWRAKLGATRMMSDIWVASVDFGAAKAKATPAGVLLDDDLQAILCVNRASGWARPCMCITSMWIRILVSGHLMWQGDDSGLGGQALSSMLLCEGALS